MSWVGRLCAVATLGLTGVGLVFVTLTTFHSSVVQAFAGAGWLLAGCMAVRYLWDTVNLERALQDETAMHLQAEGLAYLIGKREGRTEAWHDTRGGVP